MPKAPKGIPREHPNAASSHMGGRCVAATVCEAFDDAVTVLYKGQTLSHRVLSEGEPPIPLDDEKSLQQTVDNAKTRQQAAPKRKPDPDHPWRRSPVGKANELSKIESILGTRMSQNLSRDRRSRLIVVLMSRNNKSTRYTASFQLLKQQIQL